MRLLLIFAALIGGFHLGVWCTVCTIEKRYKVAWKHLVMEIKLNKQKRADAARDKEARP